MTQSSSGSRSAPSAGGESALLDHYRAAFEREHATTVKVLQAFPREQSAFRPHERSSDAKQLAWTFVVEETMILRALNGEAIVGSGFPKAPATWDEVMSALSNTGELLTAALRNTDASAISGRTVEFFVAPKKTGHIPVMDFLWFMLFDHIHHRGQLSVYVRMAGGKVPSIYGPSADEPWM